ncbi:hypothetical protein ACFOWE_30950 [Planomonospora corallina]|uniref:Uncharacterized protein n=1 Tax=Planomonospora corallina TaxID=1806052 RepID=A0ABV8IET3_9ACTN
MNIRVRRIGQTVLAVLGAALVTGLVVGGAARLLMRGVVLLLDQDGGFSLGGTVGIVVVFAVLAVPAAATAAAPRAVRTGGRWVSVGVIGGGMAVNGLIDARTALLLADDDQVARIAALAVAFGALAVAYGRLAQYLALRLAGLPRSAPSAPAPGPDGDAGNPKPDQAAREADAPAPTGRRG